MVWSYEKNTFEWILNKRKSNGKPKTDWKRIIKYLVEENRLGMKEAHELCNDFERWKKFVLGHSTNRPQGRPTWVQVRKLRGQLWFLTQPF